MVPLVGESPRVERRGLDCRRGVCGSKEGDDSARKRDGAAHWQVPREHDLKLVSH